MVERLVTDPGCYYYIGIFSTTGWTDDARDANVRGNNYQVFILECDDEFGFRRLRRRRIWTPWCATHSTRRTN